MKSNIKNAYLKLLEAPKNSKKINFKFENKSLNKKFHANMFYSETGRPKIGITENSGYNQKYLQSKLNQHLNDLLELPLLAPRQNDIILTRKLDYIENPPEYGKETQLNAATYYYSLNGGIISCNGDQLGTSFIASFIKLCDGKCDSAGATMTYTQFKLL